jgi:hypothetical protein
MSITINDGSSHEIAVDFSADVVREKVSFFVERHRLVNGAGCTQDIGCVTDSIVQALELKAIREVSPETLLGGGADALFSSCGWHVEGNPFSSSTPLKEATARSQQRTTTTSNHLAQYSANASVVLDNVYKEISYRNHLSPSDADYDIVEIGVPGSCGVASSGSKYVLAIGILSAPTNVAHRMGIR